MLFTKGAESAILPYATGGEIEKTRLHVDEFALVSINIVNILNVNKMLCIFVSNFPHRQLRGSECRCITDNTLIVL